MSDDQLPKGLEADPVDRAYAEAEAVLADDRMRLARRAAVLAAVAREAAASPPPPPDIAPRSTRRLGGWRSAAWLPGACAAGLSLFVALKIYPLVSRQAPPPSEPIQVAPASRAKSNPPGQKVAPSPALQGAPAPSAAASSARPREIVRTEAPIAAPASERERRAFPAASAPSQQTSPPPSVEPEPPPPPAAPAPPPPPSLPSPPVQIVPTPPPIAPPLTVTASRVQQGPRSEGFALQGGAAGLLGRAAAKRPDPAGALRAAAAAGRVEEARALLEHGAPVDATDADGETALMKGVRADRPEIAALLYRHGASLDRRNRAGESARDMAAAQGDPALLQALGLIP